MNVDDPMESDPASSSYWFDILREQSSNSILPWKDSDDFKLIESLPILQDDDDYILDEQLEETEESSSTSCSSSSCCLSRAMDELHQRETLPKLKTTEEEKEKVSDTRHHRTPRLEPTEEELQEALNTRQRRALKTFYHRLKDLVQFIKEYQHSDVPQKFDKNPQLGTVNKIRQEKKKFDSGNKKSNLNEAKIRLLNDVGFSWGVKKGDTCWEKRFGQLCCFRNSEGHCNVPTRSKDETIKALGRWVSTQRNQYKLFRKKGLSASLLDYDKIDRLTGLGFQWEMIKKSQPPRDHDCKNCSAREDDGGKESKVADDNHSDDRCFLNENLRKGDPLLVLSRRALNFDDENDR